MSQIIRSTGDQLAQAFSKWALERYRNGARLIVVDGMMGAGKSHLLTHANVGHTIDLDNFLDPPVPESQPWLDRVLSGGAVTALLDACKAHPCVMVGGAVAWPVAKHATSILDPNEIKRVYLKKMGTLGGRPFWDDGETLETLHSYQNRAPYFASIDDYHARFKPWDTSDLILERIGET